MKIRKSAVAGTLESSDCMISVVPKETDDVVIEIESIVYEQYGDAIRAAAKQAVDSLDVTGAVIRIQDRGAYDCVIAARMETALMRGAEGGDK